MAIKRALDVVVAAVVLVVFAPILLAIAAAICFSMGWPPLFTQVRAGLRGRLFRIYKFRTMTRAIGADGKLLPDAARLTSLGRYLRRTSLDELPELFNVLKGDMSLVGPRPLLPEYLPHYSVEQARRHDVRPGITGLCQIGGRNDLSWEQKLALDVRYVEQASLLLDAKILLQTAGEVLSGKGVSAPGHATMPRFDDMMEARRRGER